MSEPEWWRDAVVYQIYPRSFQDSDGDGTGDLQGIRSRLDHIVTLGADALWLSPIYPSPMADGGYDVADYAGVDPMFGDLAQFDLLVGAAHARGLKVLMDIVPCHTSIEHPWFTERPDWYVWSDRDGPRNNWRATFGGPAWSRDPHGRGWYLHSFYPEQPDLNWRNPEVREAMAGVLRFWRERGVDGFRLDAIDRLLKDPEMRDDPVATVPPPLPEANEEYAGLQHVHSRNAPDIGIALAALREGAGDAFLVGEVYLPSAELAPYLEHLEVAFSFELFHASWDATAVPAAVAAAVGLDVAWVLSNHDFPRLPDRVGEVNARAAAMLALTLPGPVFVYQGDEIAMAGGADGTPPDDRAGRDPFRTPMCWDADAPHGGFSDATPWLPAACPPGGGVAQQDAEPTSALHLYRDLVALRRSLGPGLELVDAADGVIAFRRGDDHLVALNLSSEERPAPAAGAVVRHTHGATGQAPQTLSGGEGFVATLRG
ncbi:MAG: GH13_23 / GH13_30 / GH13_17 / GH13 / GH13_ 31 / GH13_40 / GH13_36 / GH13_29 / GH13_16 / GH13 _35 / GH13_20 / GH13_4 / GH13_2 / GH13_1 / GH13 _34 / GH13_21 / GH13_19 / GH13_37 [uncultured Solirubrobacteraceae bacterium]|uniref:GH13_23 / GH13_30 / GH13_17 / GH13 / GH13_ 31 / GH13_40 / GH13_36 / GH13_29 / GH13_16 / GH13 _35 / GH13_20 / GH13_4 / GH13_2 / GH13_1 / GH13 _34 / GH13_21 / GH13_19 / GH13_37 n=1 Tax=uncultured Solirubrobacteraceae bacterium TaxID=1162706 RepID=A0A6J4TMW1_9ACTN|nr:MAG: GH13_23 / GH13_30 / GH13_17 / GH13 / GH13_ 31 / GH13_40 / GH13_36 / GH13_29 / GH13_16 / GH13 _35 / GH13_20 / GH13_4 / GH13_2 / GH13_1 / GH13 _34 / GH13_21 / GH13_19 / GH13_37 [uncultured Solirubrobacteraceae bacterium]